MENNNNNYNDYNYEDEMMQKKRNRKMVAPMLLAVFTIAVLAIGATYAYITVTATNNFDSPTIKGSVPKIGTVSIAAGKSLNLNLSRTDVMLPQQDTKYYATSDGTPSTDEGTALQNIGYAQVTGEGTFNCTYQLKIEATGDLITKAVGKGENLLVLNVQYGSKSEKIDFNNAFETKTLEGEFTGLTQEGTTTAGKANSINASFEYVNSLEQNQSELNGANGTITLSIEDFNCTATA